MSPIRGCSQQPQHISVTSNLTQYAEARYYPKKRCLGFDFKFKNFSIKQAIFIKDIFPSRVKVPTQKKN
jgi:hypothetical protein